MPIYEYICKDCAHSLEIIRPMKEADQPLVCEECRGQNMLRKISSFFAQSSDRSLASAGNKGCAGCSGGSCNSCGH